MMTSPVPISDHALDDAQILLVDDQPSNLEVLEAMLSMPDWRLVRARSADEALLALLHQEFAAIGQGHPRAIDRLVGNPGAEELVPLHHADDFLQGFVEHRDVLFAGLPRGGEVRDGTRIVASD